MYMGSLHPIHNIKPMGIPFCAYCPAVFDGAHLKECEGNKLKAAETRNWRSCVRSGRIYQAEARAKREAEPGESVEVG